MGVNSKNINYTIYTIKCDCCGRETMLSTYNISDVYNCRDAVRYFGWSYGRDDKIRCNICRCHKKMGFIKK